MTSQRGYCPFEDALFVPKGEESKSGSPTTSPPPPTCRTTVPPFAAGVRIDFKQIQARAKKKAEKKSRLHLSAAQQLIASQDADGHFDAHALAFKLAKVWEKLVPMAPMPIGAAGETETNHNSLYTAPALGELSTDLVDATVFVIRLFEIYTEKSGISSVKEREQVTAWFGSGGILRDRWLREAEGWLVLHRADWRAARLEMVDKVVEKWFDTKADCKHRGTFVDSERLQAEEAEINEKFAVSQTESLHRGEKWLQCTPADIETVPWEQVTAISWCMGGEGGAYLVRFGSEKLLVKRCNDVGDVIADELAKMLGVRSAPLRFVSLASPEYARVERALTAAEPDEPEMGRRLQGAFARMHQTGHPLMVMQFVPGEPLIGYKGSQVLQNSGTIENSDLMRALGCTIAFDCLMNNFDRLPALPKWPRRGNLENVLITQNPEDGKDELVFIDQAVKLLTEAKDQREYFYMLRSFVDEVESACGSCDLVRNIEPVGGMQRIKKAIHSSVILWTGDKAKDSELYERFMIKPESVPGVDIRDGACHFLLEGLSEAFSRAKALRSEFAAKRVELSERCLELFMDIDAEQRGRLADRTEACLDFVYACLGVVESKALCREYTNVA